MKRLLGILLMAFCSLSVWASLPSHSDVSVGITAFHDRRWKEALGVFLNILVSDPQNAQARTYLNLTVRAIEAQQNAKTQEGRLSVLAQTARRLEGQRLDAEPLQKAILDFASSDQRVREERWNRWCEEAEVEIELGHLLAANDLVLRVIAENSGHVRAQQLLSDVQSRTQFVLANGSTLASEAQFALEGFDAYSRADYEAAETVWQKSAALIEQAYPPAEAAARIEALRIAPYWKIATERAEEKRAVAQVQALFNRAAQLYADRHYEHALQAFRKVAVLNPEFPQLGFYLARAEAAVEKNRAQRLGEQRQKEIVQLFEAGFNALQNEHYPEAELSFKKVLSMDPEHGQARSYLSLVEGELNRRYDPQAAQKHYESGLVAYASGKLEDALREWVITARMNPGHPKVFKAMGKVRKELAMNREVPAEIIP